ILRSCICCCVMTVTEAGVSSSGVSPKPPTLAVLALPPSSGAAVTVTAGSTFSGASLFCAVWANAGANAQAWAIAPAIREVLKRDMSVDLIALRKMHTQEGTKDDRRQ